MALAGLFLVACKPAGPTLDGTWTMSGDGFAALPGSTSEMTFSGDNLEMNMVMTEATFGTVKMTAKGTYKLDGETLTPTFTSAKADASGLKDAQMRTGMEQAFKQDEITKQMNKDLKSTVKFVSDDHVEIKNTQGTIILKRK